MSLEHLLQHLLDRAPLTDVIFVANLARIRGMDDHSMIRL